MSPTAVSHHPHNGDQDFYYAAESRAHQFTTTPFIIQTQTCSPVLSTCRHTSLSFVHYHSLYTLQMCPSHFYNNRYCERRNITLYPHPICLLPLSPKTMVEETPRKKAPNIFLKKRKTSCRSASKAKSEKISQKTIAKHFTRPRFPPQPPASSHDPLFSPVVSVSLSSLHSLSPDP